MCDDDEIVYASPGFDTSLKEATQTIQDVCEDDHESGIVYVTPPKENVLETEDEALARLAPAETKAHALLDAADAPKHVDLSQRLVLIAKQWFRHHSPSQQDKISTALRKLLLAAGDHKFLNTPGQK